MPRLGFVFRKFLNVIVIVVVVVVIVVVNIIAAKMNTSRLGRVWQVQWGVTSGNRKRELRRKRTGPGVALCEKVGQAKDLLEGSSDALS